MIIKNSKNDFQLQCCIDEGGLTINLLNAVFTPIEQFRGGVIVPSRIAG